MIVESIIVARQFANKTGRWKGNYLPQGIYLGLQSAPLWGGHPMPPKSHYHVRRYFDVQAWALTYSISLPIFILVRENSMNNVTSLFGKWLETKGIALVDYAEMRREQKVALQDEFDAHDWAEKSKAAVAEAAKAPADFWLWLMGAHGMDRTVFGKLSAREQSRLADAHSYALAQAKKTVEAASQKPVIVPRAIQDMPEGMGKNRAILDYVNRKSLEDAGYISRQECAD